MTPTDRTEPPASRCSAQWRSWRSGERRPDRSLAGIAGRQWPLVGALLAALVTTGCGRPAYQLETAPVSGRVTLDGQPVTSGYVFVVPSKGRMAKGSIQPDGTFALTTYETGDGAQVGSHSVIVTPVPRDEGFSGPRERNPIPAKYARAQTSGLTLDVKPDGNSEVLLELSSGS